MERREQVFVSSTYLDLREERQAVIQTLLQADCFPAGMELFPASDDEKWDLIRRVIDDSDYYVVVIGGRYGSTDGEGLSFTEKEFDYAAEIGKPIMGFLHGATDQIPLGKADLDEKARTRLEIFRDKVSKRMVKYWTKPADLAGGVALSLIQTRKTHPAEGWIRASNALTPEVEKELAELRAQVAIMRNEVEARESAETKRSDVADLAQGNDEYQMAVVVYYWTQEDVQADQMYPRNRRRYATEIAITWNAILSELGPLMMNEASETVLAKKLDELAWLYMPEPPPNTPEAFGEAAGAESMPDVVQDVKVQLFSLGLISESEKRHPIQDKAHYWSLTSAGRDALLRLRAIRRDDD